MKHKNSIVVINALEEEMELEEEKDCLVKRKRTKFSRSIVQPQQGTEVSDVKNKMPGGLPFEVSAGKDSMDGLTDCALDSSGQANGYNKGHVCDTSFPGNEPARSKLQKICTAMNWKEPSYDFEEEGPAHNKLFKCKVTVHIDGLTDTIMECFSDPKHRKEAAQEHAAQGALWCLKCYGYVK